MCFLNQEKQKKEREKDLYMNIKAKFYCVTLFSKEWWENFNFLLFQRDKEKTSYCLELKEQQQKWKVVNHEKFIWIRKKKELLKNFFCRSDFSYFCPFVSDKLTTFWWMNLRNIFALLQRLILNSVMKSTYLKKITQFV